MTSLLSLSSIILHSSSISELVTTSSLLRSLPSPHPLPLYPLPAHPFALARWLPAPARPPDPLHTHNEHVDKPYLQPSQYGDSPRFS